MDQTHSAIGFQPVEDNVLLRPIPTEDLPGAVAWGDVVAVGPGRRTSDGTLLAPSVAPGDCVALRPGSAMPMRLGGRSLAIVGGADVLGVLLHGAAEPVVAAPEPGAAEAAPADSPIPPAPAIRAEESLETDVAPDELDRATPTSEDLH